MREKILKGLLLMGTCVAVGYGVRKLLDKQDNINNDDIEGEEIYRITEIGAYIPFCKHDDISTHEPK